MQWVVIYKDSRSWQQKMNYKVRLLKLKCPDCKNDLLEFDVGSGICHCTNPDCKFKFLDKNIGKKDRKDEKWKFYMSITWYANEVYSVFKNQKVLKSFWMIVGCTQRGITQYHIRCQILSLFDLYEIN